MSEVAEDEAPTVLNFEELRNTATDCMVDGVLVEVDPGVFMALLNLAERARSSNNWTRGSRLSIDAEALFQQLRTRLHNQDQELLKLRRANERLERMWGARTMRVLLEDDEPAPASK